MLDCAVGVAVATLPSLGFVSCLLTGFLPGERTDSWAHFTHPHALG